MGAGDPMNTFLPSPNFDICARVLDNHRLMRQIQEASWIAAYLGKKKNIQGIATIGNHPVFKLWITEGGKPLLAHLWLYLKAMNREYQIRYGVTKDHASFTQSYWLPKSPKTIIRWSPLVHASHRAKLLQKNKRHYMTTFRLFKLKMSTAPIQYVWGHPEECRLPEKKADSDSNSLTTNEQFQ